MMKKLLALFVITILTSCASIQKSVGVDEKPDIASGYIIGAFHNSYRESTAGLAIEITCESEKDPIFIKLATGKIHPGVDIFPVNAGVCEIQNLVRLGTAGDIMRKSTLVKSVNEGKFEVSGGTLTYIGNFDGKTTSKMNAIGVIGGMGWVSKSGTESVEIEIKPIEWVKAQIESKYPSFSGVPISNGLSLNK